MQSWSWHWIWALPAPIRSSPMTSSDPTVTSPPASERPEGVIFLGESQWVLGNRPQPPSGPITTLLASPPLRATAAGNGVVSISLDLRLLAALP